MKTSQAGGSLQGLHTYNVLANKKYCDRFMYLPYALKDRKTFIVSMYKHDEMRECSLDVVRCVSDLAFMPTGKARAIEFNPEYLWKQWQVEKQEKEKREMAGAGKKGEDDGMTKPGDDGGESAVHGEPVTTTIQ